MKEYRPHTYRKRTLTENIGVFLTKSESAMVKAHVKAQHMTISDYLRAVAIRPLLAQAQVQDEQQE